MDKEHNATWLLRNAQIPFQTNITGNGYLVGSTFLSRRYVHKRGQQRSLIRAPSFKDAFVLFLQHIPSSRCFLGKVSPWRVFKLSAPLFVHHNSLIVVRQKIWERV